MRWGALSKFILVLAAGSVGVFVAFKENLDHATPTPPPKASVAWPAPAIHIDPVPKAPPRTAAARRDLVRPDQTLQSGFGSRSANPLEIYRAGIAPDATPVNQYVASEVLSYCLRYLERRPYAEHPDATAEQIIQVNAAREKLKLRCSSLDSERLDWLRDSQRKLTAATEGATSEVSRGYVTFTVRLERQRQVAVDRLNAVVHKYGAASLHWLGPELSNYISSSQNRIAKEIRAISHDSYVYGHGVYMAMCDSGEICSSDGLFYTWLCTELWKCGGSVPKAISTGLTNEETEKATAIGKLISEAIRNKSF